MKVILDTPLVKIKDTGNEYQMLINMSQGGVLEHEPFPRTLQGLVSALQLAAEICAGKFFPRRALTGVQLESKLLKEGKTIGAIAAIQKSQEGSDD